MALRWAAALHRLALQGLAPWSALWPPAACDDAALGAAVDLAWRTQRASLRAMLAGPPQTNEVQRSAALLPGLLHVAEATRLPIALLEIGASAGLNLWPDRHRYDCGGWQWGDTDAPLQLRARWTGPAPALAAPLRLVSRAGCDLQPIDVTDGAAALRLRSYVWADQRDRLARLDAAIAAAAGWMRAEGVAVERRRAADFVAAQLALPRDGVTSVLMHSIVWQYIDGAEQAAIRAALDAAGARASVRAPLAWLRLELPAADAMPELRCRIWPCGGDTLLARAHPHATAIEWLA